jgi:hypothetical protein
LHNISANKIEEFISDSDIQFMSDNSNLECTYDLSEDSDHGVVTSEAWNE